MRLIHFAAMLVLSSCVSFETRAATAGPSTLAPATPEALAGTIRDGLQRRDLALLESLFNWDGASPVKHRIVDYELRRCFGLHVGSATAEAIGPDAVSAVTASGRFRLNMDISARVRVTFTDADGLAPLGFLVGQTANGYRIALINPTTAMRGQ